jgi:membrane fusion protein (multidrug efflux system)
MNQFRCYFWFLLIAISPLFLQGCSGTSKESEKKTGPKSVTVGGLIIQPGTLQNTIMATGNIMANEEVELRTELPGRIISINFEEGSLVSKGVLLMKTDDRELQAQLKKLMVEEKQARDDLYRKEKLLELKAVSQEEYDISNNALGILLAQMDLVKTQISKTEIIAPFSGKIGLRQVSPGGFISSSTLVARLQQTDPVKIDFAIPEKYRNNIKPGTLISFTVEGNDSLFSGKIYATEPKIDPATRNLQIRARCENPKGLLMPGAFAKVTIILDKFTDALVIPSEAIIPQLNGEKVFLCVNGKAKSQVITTGVRTEREVQVIEGLKSGDTIVTTGYLQLREGADIKIRFQK